MKKIRELLRVVFAPHTQEFSIFSPGRYPALSVVVAAVFCFLPPTAKSGTISIYSNADSGTGSLRWAVDISNASGGTNAINWIYGSGGTLTLLSDLAAINGNTTLDASNSITDAVIADSTNSMSLGGIVIFRNDSISSTFTVHEDIGGAGLLIKTGDGMLVLTGDNSYSGGTYINGGMLAIDGDESLGASGAGLSFDGGKLRVLDDISSARAITLGTAGGIFDTNSYTLSLTGLISGAGGFQKTGTGTLALYSANTYLGTTTITAGTLALGTDNAISVVSTVTLASGAVLDLGGHTQALASVTSAGTLRLQLQSGVTNLAVAGTADIGGSALHVSYTPQIITEGQTFTPITATLLNGVFSEIYSPAAVAFTPSYYSDSLVLTASLVPFTEIGATANQRAVGAALEPLRSSPAGDMATVLAGLYTLETEQLQAALDQLGPAPLTSLRGLALGSAELRSSAFRARAEDLATGTVRRSFTSYTGEKRRMPDVEFEEHAPRRGPGATARPAVNDAPLAFFAAVNGVSAKELPEKDGGEKAGYELTGGGAYVGADYALTSHLVLGLLAGFNRQKADVYYPSDAGVSADATQYGAYVSASAGDLVLRLYAGRTRDSYETKREISFEGVSRTAKGAPRGTEENLEAGLEYRFPASTPAGGVVPYLTLNSDKLKTGAFTETGAGDLNLTVRAASMRSLRSTAGIRYFEAVENSGSVIRMSLSGAWEKEFEDAGLALTSSLAAGGNAFTVAPGAPARNALTASAKVALEQGAISYYLGYSGAFRKRYYAHLASLGFSFRF